MTDATNADMDDSVPVNELEDCSHDEKPQVEKSKGFNVGEIIEGKREKKKVERLVQSVQLAKPKERLKIESGDGDKLGEIARINHNIGKMKAPLLKPLHKILFDRPGAAASMKKNLRLFSGFPFNEESDSYFKKMKMLSKYTNTMLKTICQVLDIERSGKQSVLIERIMSFLMHPVNTGKPVPIKKKKKKKRKNTATDAKQKTSKISKSPKKSKVEGKSKAIVTDSSSDDDDDEDGRPESKEKKTSSAQESRKEDTDDSSDEDEEEVDENDEDDDDDKDEEEERPKSKSPSKKKPATPKKVAASKKSKPTPGKKKQATKKTEKDMSDASDKSESDGRDNQNDSDFDNSKKKPTAKKKLAKPAPKTKKADSSSNKTAKKRQVIQDDSSDDDTPLIKMIKRPPTDDQIKTTVQDLLKDANLEEVTMKQLCQKVYDAYPEFDLTSRKDYIKETVKSLIS